MDFSAKVEKLRAERRLSQADLADRCGIAQSRLSEWKRPGHRGPSLTIALRLARALGVSLDYLADESVEEPPPVMTPEERIVLTAFRRMGLDADEALRRLWMVPEMEKKKPITSGGQDVTDDFRPRRRKRGA